MHNWWYSYCIKSVTGGNSGSSGCSSSGSNSASGGNSGAGGGNYHYYSEYLLCIINDYCKYYSVLLYLDHSFNRSHHTYANDDFIHC